MSFSPKNVVPVVEKVSPLSFWMGLALAVGAIGLSVYGFSREANLRDAQQANIFDPRLADEIQVVAIEAPVLHAHQEAALELPIQNPSQLGMPIDLFRLEGFEGRIVYRIRTNPNGDDLLIDAKTGKLVAVQAQDGTLTMAQPRAEG